MREPVADCSRRRVAHRACKTTTYLVVVCLSPAGVANLCVVFGHQRELIKGMVVPGIGSARPADGNMETSLGTSAEIFVIVILRVARSRTHLLPTCNRVPEHRTPLSDVQFPVP